MTYSTCCEPVLSTTFEVIKDEASGAWHFIVKIAGKVYAAVLDSVEAVVGAFEWVFAQIKTKIEDVIRYSRSCSTGTISDEQECSAQHDQVQAAGLGRWHQRAAEQVR